MMMASTFKWSSLVVDFYFLVVQILKILQKSLLPSIRRGDCLKCLWFYSLPPMWVQRTEDNCVDGVVSPEEQPAESNKPTRVISPEPLRVCVCGAALTLTFSGCQWAWFPEPTPWSGRRWRPAEGPWRVSAWSPSEPPGVPSETPAPQSPGTTRYTLHRLKEPDKSTDNIYSQSCRHV